MRALHGGIAGMMIVMTIWNIIGSATGHGVAIGHEAGFLFSIVSGGYVGFILATMP